MSSKHKLYLIGGLSQVGKSHITKLLEARRGIKWYSTDKLRFVEEAKKLNMEIDEFAWSKSLEIIGQYDSQNSSDLLLEGIAITPDRVRDLKLVNFEAKAVFIGYSDPSYAAIRLAHKDDEGNWLGPEIRRTGRGDSYVMDGIEEELKKSSAIRNRADALGYQYFDASKFPDFEKRNQMIADYLLGG